MLFNKVSYALVAALAALGEASHHHNVLHPKRANYNSTTVVTSSVLVVPTPISTGVSGPAGPADPADPAPASASNVTLTYTLGAGTSTSVVTTTIHRTATDTHFVTATPVAQQAAQNDDASTTVWSTSTATSFVTLLPVATGSASADGNGCVAGATTTVLQRETVTVYAAPPSATAGSISAPSGVESHAVEPTPSTGNSGSGSGSAPSDSSNPGNPHGSSVPNIPAQAPYGNGTVPTPKPASSGFLTSRLPRPTGFRHH